jgi:ribosomal protein L30E
MININNLKLVAASRPNSFDPVLTKRRKFSAKLSEQIELAKALNSGKNFSVSLEKSVKNLETDEVKTILVNRNISPWWWTDKDGKYFISIKYGTKVLELAKGKSAVQVENFDSVIETFSSLKKATINGELDSVLAIAGEQIRKRFKQNAR